MGSNLQIMTKLPILSEGVTAIVRADTIGIKEGGWRESSPLPTSEIFAMSVKSTDIFTVLTEHDGESNLDFTFV